MGSSQASGYAEAVDTGLCSLDVAIRAHLASNLYPPVPSEMVPACVRAITAIEDGNPDKLVLLPEGAKLRWGNTYTRRPPAWRLEEACHLEAFIHMEE